jgi:predicted alpha/beta superfamily hydrolase
MGLLKAETGMRRECSYTVYLPDSYSNGDAVYPVIFVQDGELFAKVAEAVFASLSQEGQTGRIVVSVSSPDRMDAYTPWSSPSIHPESPPFGGHGCEYLHFLTEDLHPFLASRYRMRTDRLHTAITGFSLGGLLALYTLYAVPAFGQVAAISPSCWYPGWINFIQENELVVPNARVLLVAGRAEGNNRPYPLSNFTQYLKDTHTILGSRLAHPPAAISWDDGTHPQYQKERQEKAFRWLFDIA